ncbi:hypothetical protein VL4N_06580 [Vagococcus lutrae]|uniref:DUF7604 domain-containing protein n=1 Tax=Vagococcus lutrae TaxID=81947 RepID=UPI00192643E1|nr:SpaA isopeptide-forming pilin-related protein [Vagococcus lutrae]UQF71629.1 SpaA isopeptide-forming pilin-related protein [Vagococcus lutrae]GEQ61655.1 hypothetical protein VL2N_09910 [Vagococcus lutrae]GEQ63216.1 hypothetical protein VL3N_06580 [Vagococcus lutrae]GEQ65108.1 hypothetical protein VL4N_06580 [Vagococcus lutrae]
MKIKMKKFISLVLVLLILLSNSPISLAMDKESFGEHTKESNSIVITNTQEIKEDSPDEKRKSESKSNSLEIKNSEDLTKGSIINSFETSKELPKTYFYENGEIEISIELKQGTLQEEAQLIVKEVDSEKDDRQLGLQKRITNMITEKLNEKQKLNKAKIYDIYFINKDGDRIHDLEILNIHYVFKKPFSLEEQNELSIFSLFNNELIDCKDTEIKRNDRNEIVELSFEVDKIEQLILIDTVEKNINLKEESQEVHEEELKEEQEDKRTDKLKEFTLNYSDYEKKLISKFEKLVKDKSGESRLTHQDALELKDKFDIKDYDENSPEYIDISNIEIKDGNFFIDFYKNSESKIKKIELEVAKELTLEEEIYSDKDKKSAKLILKELTELEKSIEKLNEVNQSQKDFNNLEAAVKKLYDKKHELIQSLGKIKISYNFEDQGLERLDSHSVLEDKVDIVSLIPKNSNDFEDFTLAFKSTVKEINSINLLKIIVEGDIGKQVIIFENSQFAETNHADGLIPRSYNRQPDIFQMGKVPNLQKHKTIDYLGDGIQNPDTNIQKTKTPEEIADNYRIYLDLNSKTQVETEGVDLVLVLDRSGSMSKKDMNIPGYKYKQSRAKAIDFFLNGPNDNDGFVYNFLNQNEKNNLTIVDFGGVGGLLGNPFYTLDKDSKILLDWTNKPKTVRFTNGFQEGTNYDAGLKRAEQQFLARPSSANKKAMIFLSDGVPTFYVWHNGKRYGSGAYDSIINVNNVRKWILDEEEGTLNRFYNSNPDVSTVAIGVSKDINDTGFFTSQSPEVLKAMSKKGNGIFLGIKEDISELTKSLSNTVLYSVSEVKVKDTLSKDIKLDSIPDFKVTVTDTNGMIKTLWENGNQTAQNENGRYIQSVKTQKVNEEESVILTFNPDYKLDKNMKFTLSYNITIPKETFEEYQRNGYPHRGDFGTDYADNKTSSNKAGFKSNKEAYVDYVFGPEEKPYKEFYDHPVVQVALQNLSVKKIDSVGNSLENAKFAIYKENPDENQNVQPLKLYDNEDLKGDKKTEFITNDKDEIKIYGLVHGTYYLKEIEAPEGFSKIDNSLKIEVSRLGKVSMKADDNFSLNDNTVIVKNELMGGYELPTTGGSGSTIFRLTGLLVLAIALIIPYRKRQIKCER